MLLFPEWISFALAAFSAFLVGVGKTGVPSLSLLFNALMLAAIPTKDAIGMVLLLLVVGDVFAVGFYRQHAHWQTLWRLLPAIAFGLIVGTFLLNEIPNALVQPIIGSLLISLFILDQMLSRGWLRFDKGHPLLAHFFGSIMGVGTIVGNSAGPISAMYFMLLKFDKYRFMGTSAWLFLIVNLTKIPLLMSIEVVHEATFYSLFYLFPFIFVGVFVGKRVLKVIPERVFSTLVVTTTLGTSSYFILNYFFS